MPATKPSSTTSPPGRAAADADTRAKAQPPPASTDPLERVVAVITPSAPHIVNELTQLLLDDIEVLRSADSFSRLHASVEGNVMALLHLMQHRMEVKLIEAPAGAIAYARRLAQLGVPFSSLLRAYHLANAHFFELCLLELANEAPDHDQLAMETAYLSHEMHAYVDHVCERIARVYDAERESCLRQRGTLRLARIRAVLDGEHSDPARTESELEYAVSGRHVGVIAWDDSDEVRDDDLPRIERLVTSLAEVAGCVEHPLSVARD